MTLEAPNLVNTLERSDEISIEQAQLELNSMGEAIAKEIKNMREVSRIGIVITALFNRGLDYTNQQEVISEIYAIKDLLIKLSEAAGIANGSDSDLIRNLISEFEYSIPSNEAELLSWIDKLLTGVIKLQVDLASLNKFFQKVKGECETRHQNTVSAAVTVDSEHLSFDYSALQLPININYILNPETAYEREKHLRKLKERLQMQASLLFQHSAAEYIESIHGTDLVDSDEELYRQQEFYQRNKGELVDNSIPTHVENGYPLELMTILKGEVDNVTFRQLNNAKIQLLRVYREFVNTIISSGNIDTVIAEEQNGNSTENLRIGVDNDGATSKNRRVRTRRLELFNMWHMGVVQAEKVNPRMNNGNLVPISQDLLDFTGGKKDPGINKGEILSRLTLEQKRRLALLENLRDVEFDESVDSIPSQIFSRFLMKIGIATPPEYVQEQIEMSDKKLPNTKFRTYTVKVRPSGTIAVDNTYRTLLVHKTWKPKLSSIMKSLQHEAGHLMQQISRDQSLLPGLNLLSGLGRSGTLAEAGAIKSEALMTGLLDQERQVNTYHVDIIKNIINGKSYWEIIDDVLQTLYNRSIANGENRTKEDLVRTAVKTVNRAYNSLGAMGNLSDPNGRYPTEAGFLSYTYQGLPEFSKQPYYVSGIPAHRTDLQEFIPQPKIEGVPIDEMLIAEIIIDSAYEILVENGIIPAEH